MEFGAADTCIMQAFMQASSRHHGLYTACFVHRVSYCTRRVSLPVHSQIRVTHGTNLALAGLQARAVSVVTQTIQDAIRMYGTDHQATVMAAASLARTFVTLEHYDTASDIYTRAWEAAGRCLLPNDRTHTLLFKEFAVSLRHAGRFTAYCALLVQAEDRGLPVHDCLNTLI